MPYNPPTYAERDDWRTVLPNIGSGNSVNSWVFDMIVYWQLRTPPTPLPVAAAWKKARMPKEHAQKALSQARLPPEPTNLSGVVPPEVIEHLFARALAESVDPATTATVARGDAIRVVMGNTARSFTPPSYSPRQDWQHRLEGMDPEEGSWQGDLVRYWSLRIGGASERDAWREVAMTPANAKMALNPQDPNDAGLVPSLPNDEETVAKRVLARSGASKIDADDIFEGLSLL